MKAILLDLDGVFYKGDSVMEGAIETVAWLQKSAISHLFLTNTTSRPCRKILEKLHGFGINIRPEKVLTPVIAAANWLKENTTDPAALFVPQETQEDFGDIARLSDVAQQGAGSVVVGDLGEAWDFQTLNRAFRLLIDDQQIPLIALGMTRYWRAEDGLRLDVAPFVKALEHAVGREAIVLGKPAEGFFDAALNIISAKAEDTYMIGDDIVGDVQGAQLAGLKGILVKTGKFRDSDLKSSITPDVVLDSIADLPVWWEQNISYHRLTARNTGKHQILFRMLPYLLQ